MREVAATAVLTHVDLCRDFGLLVGPEHFEGLPFDEAGLRTRGGRVDWDPYATLLSRMCAGLADEALIRMGAGMDRTGPWLNTLLSSVVGPVQVLRFWDRLAPVFWRGMTWEHEVQGRRAQIRGRIPAHYAPCRALWVASAGACETMPCRFGLPRAELLGWEAHGHHGVYEVLLPESRTVPARLARRVSHFEDLTSFLHHDQDVMTEAFEAVRAAEERLSEANQRTELLAAALSRPSPLWIVAADGIRWSNPAAEAAIAHDPSLAARVAVGGPGLRVTEIEGGHRLVSVDDPEAERAQRLERATQEWKLTPAQVRVLALVADGTSNKDVGTALGINPGTVEVHLTQLFRKSGAANRAALVARFWAR